MFLLLCVCVVAAVVCVVTVVCVVNTAFMCCCCCCVLLLLCVVVVVVVCCCCCCVLLLVCGGLVWPDWASALARTAVSWRQWPRGHRHQCRPSPPHRQLSMVTSNTVMGLESKHLQMQIICIHVSYSFRSSLKFQCILSDIFYG